LPTGLSTAGQTNLLWNWVSAKDFDPGRQIAKGCKAIALTHGYQEITSYKRLQLREAYYNEMSDLPQYSYSPLPAEHIRLLKITQADEQILCSLTAVPLSMPPDFKAISYC
jgi:hypothetical protein